MADTRWEVVDGEMLRGSCGIADGRAGAQMTRKDEIRKKEKAKMQRAVREEDGAAWQCFPLRERARDSSWFY